MSERNADLRSRKRAIEWNAKVRTMIATGRTPSGAKLTPRAVADEMLREMLADAAR